ncbi:MAG: response regulator [Oligoflexia bacterium]|nr:response regulator [Oligoflexia bacterium]MBF0366785.1 response regulator [Oligoflexia bacterium]
MSKQFKFLVVDDEEDITTILSEFIIDNFPCIVEVASDGKKALLQCSNNSYDVIMSDYRMPEMSGTEFINNLRASEGKNQLTPVVILSSFVEEAMKQQHNSTHVHYIDKTRYPQDLVPKLKQILGQ